MKALATMYCMFCHKKSITCYFKLKSKFTMVCVCFATKNQLLSISSRNQNLQWYVLLGTQKFLNKNVVQTALQKTLNSSSYICLQMGMPLKHHTIHSIHKLGPRADPNDYRMIMVDHTLFELHASVLHLKLWLTH